MVQSSSVQRDNVSHSLQSQGGKKQLFEKIPIAPVQPSPRVDSQTTATVSTVAISPNKSAKKATEEVKTIEVSSSTAA